MVINIINPTSKSTFSIYIQHPSLPLRHPALISQRRINHRFVAVTAAIAVADDTNRKRQVTAVVIIIIYIPYHPHYHCWRLPIPVPIR